MIDLELQLEWNGRRYASVDTGLRAFAAANDKSLDAYFPLVRRLLDEYMKAVLLSVRSRVGGAYPGGTSSPGAKPGTLSRRSGGLLASLSDDRVKVGGGDASEVSVSYTLSGIAAVHERGAIITAKKAKYLTIPLPAALNSQGVPLRRGARDWSNTFILRSKRGNLLIVLKQGGKITPLYVLKKSVKIPPRLNFGDAFSAGRDFLADKIAQQMVREFING